MAVVIKNERPQFHWLLFGAVFMDMYHALLLVGQGAEHRGRTNVLTRRCTVCAWLFPVASHAFAVWNALTACARCFRAQVTALRHRTVRPVVRRGA